MKAKEFLKSKGYDWVHKKLVVNPQHGQIIFADKKDEIDIIKLMDEFASEIIKKDKKHGKRNN